MNVLVIGQGGREHALVKALRLAPSVQAVHALPGSDGMAQEAHCHNIDWQNFEAVTELVQRERIDLVVVGPEVPLVGGLSDALRMRGVAVVGPSREAAQLEGSKIYSKQFMVEAGVRTARSEVVGSVAETRGAMERFSPPYVLKADGLAAGKGVFICQSDAELLEAAKVLFEDRLLGEAGSQALLEEFQPGYEISYLVLTDGETFEPLILAQDHKRLMDRDQGPNTGGMGVVAPVEIDSDLRAQIDREVVQPVIAQLHKRKLLYRGVLYIGLMITDHGPSVLEFNTRFGDPEAQALLPLLDGDWGLVFKSLAAGERREWQNLKWKNEAAACVVLAAEGYPDHPVKGAAIQGLEKATQSNNRYFLHAGTALTAEKQWLTAGGRVLNAVGIGKNLAEAVNNAYFQAGEARWSGLQLRHDIGAKLLN